MNREEAEEHAKNMTYEEAEKTISKMLSVTDLTVRANMTAKMIEACHMAIRALKQADALDEIRAEIVELQKDYHEYGWAYDDVLEIIDKYTEAKE